MISASHGRSRTMFISFSRGSAIRNAFMRDIVLTNPSTLAYGFSRGTVKSVAAFISRYARVSLARRTVSGTRKMRG